MKGLLSVFVVYLCLSGSGGIQFRHFPPDSGRSEGSRGNKLAIRLPAKPTGRPSRPNDLNPAKVISEYETFPEEKPEPTGSLQEEIQRQLAAKVSRRGPQSRHPQVEEKTSAQVRAGENRGKFLGRGRQSSNEKEAQSIEQVGQQRRFHVGRGRGRVPPIQNIKDTRKSQHQTTVVQITQRPPLVPVQNTRRRQSQTVQNSGIRSEQVIHENRRIPEPPVSDPRIRRVQTSKDRRINDELAITERKKLEQARHSIRTRPEQIVQDTSRHPDQPVHDTRIRPNQERFENKQISPLKTQNNKRRGQVVKTEIRNSEIATQNERRGQFIQNDVRNLEITSQDRQRVQFPQNEIRNQESTSKQRSSGQNAQNQVRNSEVANQGGRRGQFPQNSIRNSNIATQDRRGQFKQNEIRNSEVATQDRRRGQFPQNSLRNSNIATQDRRREKFSDNTIRNPEIDTQERRRGQFTENKIGNPEIVTQDRRRGEFAQNEIRNPEVVTQDRRRGQFLQNEIRNLKAAHEDRKGGQITQNEIRIPEIVTQGRQRGQFIQNDVRNKEAANQDRRRGEITQNERRTPEVVTQERRREQFTEDSTLGRGRGQIKQNPQFVTHNRGRGEISQNKIGNPENVSHSQQRGKIIQIEVPIPAIPSSSKFFAIGERLSQAPQKPIGSLDAAETLEKRRKPQQLKERNFLSQRASGKRRQQEEKLTSPIRDNVGRKKAKPNNDRTSTARKIIDLEKTRLRGRPVEDNSKAVPQIQRTGINQQRLQRPVETSRRQEQTEHNAQILSVHTIEMALKHASQTWARDPFRSQSIIDEGAIFDIDFSQDPNKKKAEAPYIPYDPLLDQTKKSATKKQKTDLHFKDLGFQVKPRVEPQFHVSIINEPHTTQSIRNQALALPARKRPTDLAISRRQPKPIIESRDSAFSHRRQPKPIIESRDSAFSPRRDTVLISQPSEEAPVFAALELQQPDSKRVQNQEKLKAAKTALTFSIDWGRK